MSDIFSKKKRSEIMAKIRSSNTKPELLAKDLLNGFQHQPKIYGRPDFINKKRKIIIFIDGCFWHKCPIHFKAPKSNKKYWLPKIKRNVERAKEVEKEYKNLGWKILRIWEHELKYLRDPFRIKKLI